MRRIMLLALLALPTATLANTIDLFVANSGKGPFGTATIGKYTTTGKTVNSALISGLNNSPFGIAVAAIPEPSTLLTFGTGVLGLVGMMRRKLKRRA